MGPVIRNSLLGMVFLLAAAARLPAQAPALPPVDAGKIPLSKIPRVHRAPKLEDFLENRPREAELTVTDFRQNTPGDGTPATESTTAYLSYDEKISMWPLFARMKREVSRASLETRRLGSGRRRGSAARHLSRFSPRVLLLFESARGAGRRDLHRRPRLRFQLRHAVG